MSYLTIDIYCVDTISQKWYWDYGILKLQLLWGQGETKVAAWSHKERPSKPSPWQWEKQMPVVILPRYRKKWSLTLNWLKQRASGQLGNKNETLQPQKFISQSFLFFQKFSVPQQNISIFSPSWTRRAVPWICMVLVYVIQRQTSKTSVSLHKISRRQITCTASIVLTRSIFGILGCEEMILVNLLRLGC